MRANVLYVEDDALAVDLTRRELRRTAPDGTPP